MNADISQNAVNAALSGNWEDAIKINKKILKDDPENIDALNRLAHAYSEIGKVTLAKQTAKKVLELDEFNPIALKSLDRWKNARKKDANPSSPTSAEVFLEEPGKTKIVPLLHIGGPRVLASVDVGDEVNMNCKGHRISICTKDGKYIGRLADDLSTHLKRLMSYGNVYKAFIKNADKENVTVFLRETKRDKSLTNINSFSHEKIDYISFTPPELVRKKENIQKTEDIDDA
jgi:tetratricopeptide (TPR) repeat protein